MTFYIFREKLDSAEGEEACYEYVKYMEVDGKMASIHSDWAKAVRWLNYNRIII